MKNQVQPMQFITNIDLEAFEILKMMEGKVTSCEIWFSVTNTCIRDLWVAILSLVLLSNSGVFWDWICYMPVL